MKKLMGDKCRDNKLIQSWVFFEMNFITQKSYVKQFKQKLSC